MVQLARLLRMHGHVPSSRYSWRHTVKLSVLNNPETFSLLLLRCLPLHRLYSQHTPVYRHTLTFTKDVGAERAHIQPHPITAWLQLNQHYQLDESMRSSRRILQQQCDLLLITQCQ
jgi:hypothetical protein